MRTPELVSLHSSAAEVVSYMGGSKLAFRIKHTDAEFWEIMEFDYIEGGAFDREAVHNAEHVAVLSDKAARQAFGNDPAVGQFLETSEGSFRVLGVIDHKQVPTQPAYADIYVPVTLDNHAMTGTNLYSRYNAYVLPAEDVGGGPIKQEFDEVLVRAMEEESGRPDQLLRGQTGHIKSVIGTQFDQAVAHFTRNDSPGAAVLTVAGIFLLMILFMLFPALNLVNINISRIIERSSEVGVRRAFGASRRALVGQFLVENIVLTFIGGVMAFTLSCIVLYIINDSGLIPYGQLDVNYHILIYAVIICLVFGFVSGVLPAYRMSRLHPVEALRGVEL
jgi:putative ABC transport system permease protein